MTTDEKGNPLTYWGGLEKAIKNTLEEAIENKIKGINVDTGFRIERSYSEEDLECAWNSSDQNMRFQFSSSKYKAITFKQWLEKFKQEK